MTNAGSQGGRKRMFLLGIGGGSNSGKTTLARKLAETLSAYRVRVIHTDDYFAASMPKMVSRYSGRELEDFNQPASWDLPRFHRELEQAMSDSEVDVLIVEGIFALFEAEIRELYDLSVFVDTPSDERFFRRIKWRLSQGVPLEDEGDYFLGTQRFRHQEFYEPLKFFADLVIGGSEITARKVDIVAAYITTELGKG